jgi:uncharacterized coiled-coil DUF342 family protein
MVQEKIMNRFGYYGLNRVLCSVLEEMRTLLKLDYIPPSSVEVLKSLVEEAQIMGNRMEAKLADHKDVEDLNEEISKLKKEANDLQNKVDSLKEDT